MELAHDILSQFVKATNDEKASEVGVTVEGTAKAYDGKIYVQLDGSDQLTPVISSTAGMKDGDRVTVLIKDHSATVTGNVSSPSASQDSVEETKKEIGNKISEFEIVIADKVDTSQLNAEKARIDDLVSKNVTITEKVTANEADIKKLTADNVTINSTLTAQKADIDNLEATKISADIADAKYATIKNLEATDANVHNLQADYAEFEQTTTDKLTANDATIKKLTTDKLDVTTAETKYANIDFANIGEAAVKKLFSDSGIIKDLIVSDGHITGELVGVTIKGDIIEGGTVVADKLVVKGEDGLFYKLNTDGVTTTAEQTEYNSLNGRVITAKTITAEKINVDDLVAFKATIGGYHITASSLYSGTKSSASNTTRGVYMNKDGEFAAGDSNNYLRFYKTSDGEYMLEISASRVKLASGKTVEDTISSAVDDIQIGGQNLVYNSDFVSNDNYWINDGGASHSFVDTGNSNYQRAMQVTTTAAYTPDRIYYDPTHFAFEADKSYSLSFYAKSSTSSTGLVLVQGVDGDSDIKEFNLSDKWQYFKREGFTPSKSGSATFYLTSAGMFYLSKIKIEMGTKTTDWSKAPFDTEQSIETALGTARDAQSEINSQIDNIEYSMSQIDILNNSIRSLVTDQDGSSLMTQTTNGWTFNIGSIQSTLSEATKDISSIEGNIESVNSLAEKTNALAQDIANKTAYINMTTDDAGAPVLELGKSDSEFKVRITHTSIDFMQGTQKIAYITNRQLYIQSSVVTDELKIGDGAGWIWKRRENGNLGLRYLKS